MKSFRALVASGPGPASFATLTDADLCDGDVTVDVSHSSLNYKDGLAVTGRGKVVRRFPIACGIDLAGTISESGSPDWQVGEEVIVTGWGLSETHPGGYSQRQRVRSGWLVRKPAGFSAGQAMAIGTAGLTAMLCVLALEHSGLEPSAGDVLVTGASGGVGSVAVVLLSQRGYQVTAVTGRSEAEPYLRALGAGSVIGRGEFTHVSQRPLEKERWAAAIDTVGSTTLGNVIRQISYRGAVAACGLAGGSDLPTTVLPFILRGVGLLGVDSVRCPSPLRVEAWRRLSADLPRELLDQLTTTHALDEVPQLAEEILAGRIRGRVVISVGSH